MKISLDISNFLDKISLFLILLFSPISLHCSFKKVFFLFFFTRIYFCIYLFNRSLQNVKSLIILNHTFNFFQYIYLFILLYNIVLVLPYIDMNPPWVYMCSPFWTPFHLPPHPIPLGNPSAPERSTLYHASNLDCWFVSHVIIYMFQCHSPISSHPCPLPQSPKHCSIHLCLFGCLAYRVIIIIFLNSIYMR